MAGDIEFERNDRITMFLHIVDSEGNLIQIEGDAPKLPEQTAWAVGMVYCTVEGYETKVNQIKADWDGHIFLWMTPIVGNEPFREMLIAKQGGWTVSDLGAMSNPNTAADFLDLCG